MTLEEFKIKVYSLIEEYNEEADDLTEDEIRGIQAILEKGAEILRIACQKANNAKKGKENTKASILFFCALSIVLGIPAISGWHTFIPLITSLLFTYAIWQENPIVLRIIAMICNVLWVIFNFKVRAYVSMVYSIFEFIVAFITLILIIRKGKKDELQDS